jgi:PAS domain S-box-containing protein
MPSETDRQHTSPIGRSGMDNGARLSTDPIGILTTTSAAVRSTVPGLDGIPAADLLDALAPGILIMDAGGRAVYMNPSARRMIGLGLDQINGTAPIPPGWQARDEAGRPLDRQHAPAHLTRTTGTPRSDVAVRLDRPDGTTVWLSIDTRPLGGGGVVMTLTDVTQRRWEQEALQRLGHQHALILNSAADGILGLDSTGTITFANPSAARLTGYEPEELTGQTFDSLIATTADGSARAEETSVVQRVLRVGSPRRETGVPLRRKDGSTFPAEYVCAPIPDGDRIVGAVVTFKDISERLAVERMKDEFISVVSHELRTPLTSIRGALGLLASGLAGQLPERGQQMLAIAVKNTERLIALINDILDIERIESGAISMEKRDCNLADLMTQAAELMQPMAEKAGIRLEVAPRRAPLFVDPDRLIQVLTNLLSNAIKFSPPGSRVWMDAEASDGRVWIRVRDEGRGIPPEKLEVIFERFQQVDASDAREKGGTGLGLAICRSIVRQHGGQIWAESGPAHGPGSTFHVVLPGGAAPPTAGAGARPLILVCDDDPSVCEVLRGLLEAHGYAALTVGDGAAAVCAAVEHRPAAILLDLLMPPPSGWQTIETLKRQPETQAIPVIICSALPPADPSPPEPPVVDWLTKPLDEASLFAALERALARDPRRRVLIVEDDEDLGAVLVTMFQRHGLDTYRARTGQEALRLGTLVHPDLIILDLILPDGDGFSVVDWLRREDRLRDVALVVYSARDLTEADRQRLTLGETRYLTKGRVTPEEFERYVIALLEHLVSRSPATGRPGARAAACPPISLPTAS